MNNISRKINDLLDNGVKARRQGEFERARDLLQEALAESRRIKDRLGEAYALLELSAVIVVFDKDFTTGHKMLTDSLKVFTEIRSPRGRAYAMNNLGSLELDQQNYDVAINWFNDALRIFEAEHDKYGIAMTLHQMGKVDKERGDMESAERRWRQSLLLLEGLGNKYGAAQTMLSLAGLNVAKDELEQANALLNRALMIFKDLGNTQEVDRIRKYLAQLDNAMESRRTEST